jgi:hypothetical protein
MTREEQVDELLLEYRQLGVRAKWLISRADDKFTVRPASGGWSPAECLGHLNLTMEAFLPLWKTTLYAGLPLYTADLLRTDLPGKLLIWLLEPPYRMKAKTSPPFIPGAGTEDQGPHFLELNEEVRLLLYAASGLGLDKVKIPSPFAKRMKYSLWSSFRINAAHSRRHLWQAEQSF